MNKKEKYINCPVCGKALIKVAGKCDIEIVCKCCRKKIFSRVNEGDVCTFELKSENTLMKDIGNEMRYVGCLVCGKQLFKVAGWCTGEIVCKTCQEKILFEVAENHVRTFEN